MKNSSIQAIRVRFESGVRLTKKLKRLLICFGLLCLGAIFSSIIMKDPDADLFNSLLAPFSQGYILGTDDLGRDLLSGLFTGIVLSLKIGFTAALIAVLIGGFIGIVGAYFGDRHFKEGWLSLLLRLIFIFLSYFYAFEVIGQVIMIDGSPILLNGLRLLIILTFIIVGDQVVKNLIPKKYRSQFFFPLDVLTGRLIEIFDSIPKMILILTCSLFFENPSFIQISIILGVSSWTNIARLTRGEVLKVKREYFIESAKAMGLKESKIIFNYVIPNILTPILISLAFFVSGAILFEASLSFLGLGVPVDQVSLGSLLLQGKNNIQAWWLVVFPGLIIFTLVILLNKIGEELGRSFKI